MSDAHLRKLGKIKSIPSGWVLTTIGKACKIRNDLRKPLSVDERKEMQGDYPYFGPTGCLDFIDRYMAEGKFALIGEDGDHYLEPSRKPQTILLNGKFNVNNHAHIIQGTKICSVEWFFIYFHNKDITHMLSRQGANRYKLNKETLLNMPILLPPLDEQYEAFKIYQKWDRAIEVTENLITAKQQQFEWLTTRLINQSGGKKTPLSDFVTEVSTRNRGGQIERVLSVTNRNGFVLPEDQFERRVASADVSNYKVVERGQYAYNPSRINVGYIARLDDWDNGILSPMYTVFKLDNKKIDSDYFLHWLSSTEAKQRIRNSAQGSVRETVSFGDLGSIPMALPSIPEQKSIAHTLNTAQGEIKLLQALAEKYRTQKRGLMQKLLSGQWRLNDKKEAA